MIWVFCLLVFTKEEHGLPPPQKLEFFCMHENIFASKTIYLLSHE